ncbi:MAG: dephospho-CoA kinase [Candidatus Hydrogenedentes bacterium]|nr:dephospho-CoA kinase [Candidatus Hydrogenedentota bacterium]
MRIIGLTGGIGSGKSEAARHFAKLGYPVVYADKVGHAMIAPGGQAVDAVITAFGEGILTHGAIDRVKLGALIFANQAARERLETIIHPLIRSTIDHECETLQAQGCPIAIVEAALFGEEGEKDEWLAGLIVVIACHETRVRRLVELRRLSREEAEQRIAAQTPSESKVAFADWIIQNDGTLRELYEQVDRIGDQIGGPWRVS